MYTGLLSGLCNVQVSPGGLPRAELCDPDTEYNITTGLQGLRWTHVCFQAFAVCESLLEGYPAQNFVILTLNTMTQLAVHSLVNMSSHVSRLLAILNTDLRHGVHLTCLHNLHLLARSGPHLWHSSNVEVKLTLQ